MSSLTPEQIDFLRTLPVRDYPVCAVTMVMRKLVAVTFDNDGDWPMLDRTEAGDTLLATLDAANKSGEA